MLAQDLLARKRKRKNTGQAKNIEGEVASPSSRTAAAEPVAELDQIFSKAKRPAIIVEQQKVLSDSCVWCYKAGVAGVDGELMSTVK